MTSLPNHFTFGSASSTTSVRDAIASYRRAQYFVAGSTVVPDPSSVLEDEEALESPIDDDDEESENSGSGVATPRAHGDFVSEFQWDDLESDDGLTPQAERPELLTPVFPPRRTYGVQTPSNSPAVPIPRENTPLLHKAVSFSTPPRPNRISDFGAIPAVGSSVSSGQTLVGGERPPIRRRSSANSNKGVKFNYGGKSTFGQTLFNSIAILLGIGMLSEPIAFAYAGWIGGTILIVSFGFITCYTAKILAHIILSDPRLRSYADIGRKAFGPKSNVLVSVLFCSELFAVSVVLVTLYADSLHTLLPSYSANTFKIWGLVVLIPTVFLPLSLLSYTSVLGILSTVMIIAVILIDGFTKPKSPGSLWEPAETSLHFQSLGNLGIAFGLFMAGLSGHAVIPSLARDMIDPAEFDTMINWAFTVATVVYTLIGYAGYLMFGNDVSDEISMDLLKTPGYNPILNKAALWMLVISPLSKFALATRPVNVTLEIMLGIEGSPLPASPEDSTRSKGALHDKSPPDTRYVLLKRGMIMVERVLFTVSAVTVSILVPEFSTVMAFLGSFSAFVLCVIGPVSAKVALAGRCGPFDALLLGLGVVCAVWGTVSAFASAA